MASIPRLQSLRLILAASIVGLLLAMAPSPGVSPGLTKPVLMALLHLFGIAAWDAGDTLMVGGLTVPWTRDCSGLNLFIILLALAVWVNRHAPADRWYGLRIAAVFPAALLANVLRVLTLIGCRKLMYPAVESPQMHYFIGFLWLVPMVLLVTPRRKGQGAPFPAVEALHAAAVLGWLSPMVALPGGGWTAVAAIALLSQCRPPGDHRKARAVLTVIWICAGIGIGLCSIESLWLGWLLGCPLMWPAAVVRRPAFWLTLAATHPLVMMIPYGGWLGGLATMVFLLQSVPPPGTGDSGDGGPEPAGRLAWRLAFPATALAICLPFTASTLFASSHLPLMPPVRLVVQEIGAFGYELRLDGQPEPIRLVWYAAQNNDRHHTVQVCLKYRGKTITEVPGQPQVVTDGIHWLREFFVQDGRLLDNYRDYATRTLAPGSHPGAHLIFVMPMQAMTADRFDALAVDLAKQLN